MVIEASAISLAKAGVVTGDGEAFTKRFEAYEQIIS